jgi:hypothetical protein
VEEREWEVSARRQRVQQLKRDRKAAGRDEGRIAGEQREKKATGEQMMVMVVVMVMVMVIVMVPCRCV